MDSGNPIYRALWHACAGPLVSIPREAERVYYFPQGHMEQVCEKFSMVSSWYFLAINHIEYRQLKEEIRQKLVENLGRLVLIPLIDASSASTSLF